MWSKRPVSRPKRSMWLPGYDSGRLSFILWAFSDWIVTHRNYWTRYNGPCSPLVLPLTLDGARPWSYCYRSTCHKDKIWIFVWFWTWIKYSSLRFWANDWMTSLPDRMTIKCCSKTISVCCHLAYHIYVSLICKISPLL